MKTEIVTVLSYCQTLSDTRKVWIEISKLAGKTDSRNATEMEIISGTLTGSGLSNAMMEYFLSAGGAENCMPHSDIDRCNLIDPLVNSIKFASTTPQEVAQ